MPKYIESETITLKKIDSVHFRVLCEFSQSMELNEYFKCFAPNYKWHPLFKKNFWDGRISFFDSKLRMLPIGLLPMLVQFCKNFTYKLEYDFDVSTLSNEIEQSDLDTFYPNILKDSKDKLTLSSEGDRDYQNACVMKGLQNKRGVFEVGTGGGKSLSIYALSRFLLEMKKNILVIVPNTGLVEQLYNDFQDYGWHDLDKKVQRLYDRYSAKFDKKNVKPILISTWQSLQNKHYTFFKEFDAVIIDETHSAKCLSIQKILKSCKRAEYRLGFTGTLPEEKADLYTIHGFLGPTLYSINSGELIDRGILSQINIANLILKYPLDAIKECHTRGYQFEVDYTMAYKDRNRVLSYIIDNTPDDENTLVLVSRIDKHLKPVTDYIEKTHPDKELRIIYGGTDALQREKIRGELEKTKGVILLATYQTIATGFNVKNLHQIVFFSSYKSKIKVLQAIGRGLRTHKSKDQLLVFDVIDDLTYITRNKTIYNNHLVKHFLIRRRYYDRSGFKYQNKIIKLESINTIE